ncbi:MAG: BamA/TamA family outer membrane protein [Cyclobacteriaceae bacterium]|nr:BamA/TamA family outer membrane protein [Cyclobacteriaceae bacterium]
MKEEKMPVIQKKDSSAVGVMELNRLRFTPFLAPSVSPEIGLMLVGGGLVSFKLDRHNKLVQPSSVPFSIGYSTNGSANINFRPSLFFKNDKNRVIGDIWMKDMPDNYWGVGYEAGKAPSQPDSTTSYRRNWWQVYLKHSHQFRRHLFGGLVFDYNQTIASSMSPSMLLDESVQKYGSYIRNWSIGLLLQYDSRDLTINAYDGVFVELSSNFYRAEAFSKPYFQTFMIDYRQYEQVRRPGRTLAWQIKTRMAHDDVPWSEMSQLGSPFDFRGYFMGRYRDKNLLLGVVEYRHMFMRQKPAKNGNMMSRFGMTSWLASGSVASSLSEMNHWLPNAGLGIRFEVQERMNARIDYGFGNDSSALYISFNEAF